MACAKKPRIQNNKICRLRKPKHSRLVVLVCLVDLVGLVGLVGLVDFGRFGWFGRFGRFGLFYCLGWFG